MNPLTQVKNIQKITAREAAAGISEDASWHAKYKESAYVFVGGLPYDLTEGDLLAVFAQYGEIVDVNLVRDKATGKSKGFAFLAYQDQRSTTLVVDNLNGANVVGRTVRVDHVANYKKKKEEDEEEEQKKREERGVCYAFQRGECNRGSACRFSHDEQRNANTGWGGKDSGPRWRHDQYDHSSQGGQQLKPKDDSRGGDIRSRHGIQEGDNRSVPSGKPGQRKKDDGSQDILTARHKETTSKEDIRQSRYDDKRGSHNRLTEEEGGISRHDESRYMDKATGSKNDHKRRGFGSGSTDANERDEERRSMDHNRKTYDRNKNDNDRREEKYVGLGSRDADEENEDKKSRDHSKRDYDRNVKNNDMRESRYFGSGSKDADERNEDKRSRDHSKRDYDRNEKDNDRKEVKYFGSVSRESDERHKDKRSRDYSERDYDRNEKDNDRREAKYRR